MHLLDLPSLKVYKQHERQQARIYALLSVAEQTCNFMQACHTSIYSIKSQGWQV